MMRVVTVKDAKKNNTFEEVGVFRHKLFCKTRNWKSGLDIYETGISDPDNKGKFLLAEQDEFDNIEKTVYFISYNINQKIDGIVRFQSTELPYMLQKNCFRNIPGFINEDLPVSPAVWEGSRTGFDPDLDPAGQQRVAGEIVTSFFEFSLKNKIDFILGTMSTTVIYLLFGRSGCSIKGDENDDMRYMGKPVNMADPLSGAIDKNAVAAKLRISENAYQRVMEKRGTSKDLLYTLGGDKIFPGIQVLPKIPYGNELINGLMAKTR